MPLIEIFNVWNYYLFSDFQTLHTVICHKFDHELKYIILSIDRQVINEFAVFGKSQFQSAC